MAVTGQIGRALFLAGRLAVGGMYLTAGIQNLLELDAKAGYTASKGVANAQFWVAAASLLLVVGGFSIATGIRPYLGVAAIALFLVPVTLIMHNFWAQTGMQAQIELHAFMGNLGLFGSVLMFLAIPQPWAVSLDGWAASRVAALRTQREMAGGQRNATADASATR